MDRSVTCRSDRTCRNVSLAYYVRCADFRLPRAVQAFIKAAMFLFPIARPGVDRFPGVQAFEGESFQSVLRGLVRADEARHISANLRRVQRALRVIQDSHSRCRS